MLLGNKTAQRLLLLDGNRLSLFASPLDRAARGFDLARLWPALAIAKVTAIRSERRDFSTKRDG